MRRQQACTAKTTSLGCARLVRLAGVYLASSNLYARAASTGVASNLVPSTSSSSTNVWTRCRAAGRRSACAHEICTSGLSLAPRGWTLSGRCGSESLLARSSSLTSRTWHGDKTLSYGPARASSGVLCALRYDYARCGLVCGARHGDGPPARVRGVATAAATTASARARRSRQCGLDGSDFAMEPHRELSCVMNELAQRPVRQRWIGSVLSSSNRST